jgi:natural product biosynthesis luciferase-like monooxygenase protein
VTAASTVDSIGPRRFPAQSPLLASTSKFVAAPARPAAESRGMDFSLFYFASDATEAGDGKYRLLLDGARFADRNNFTAVWTPERHFHAFGGLYPNPSVTAAALAMVTERIRIRGGSVVLPLHDAIRVAEEWAVVDNLSRGRVDISFASGWHANDFVLAPENHPDRHGALFRQIDTVRRLWRGEPVTRRNGVGQEVAVRILPRPVQAELPFWVTAAGSPETFRKAGELGANLLTHLLGQSIEELAAKITIYRAARTQAGYPADQGKVTLMLHTFVGESDAEVRETVRRPFSEYLKTSLDLVAKNAGFDPKTLAPEDVDILIARVFDRYLETSGLFGTPTVCRQRVDQLKAIGVDEIACLIDFGVAPEVVLESLEPLNEVRERSNDPDLVIGFRESSERVTPANGNAALPDAASGRVSLREPRTIPEQIARHGVTHLQCTPSLAALLMQDPAALGGLARLRTLLLGGEALPAALARQIRESFTGELFNLYGPTETTIWSAGHMLQDPSRPISIGRPIANTEMYIVDRNNELVPIGIPGELLIGGVGVARGYHERPELTRERFIPHLFGADPSLRLYRTGDLARYMPDGQIEFLGRIDQQVKLRGHRIELGEIETLLSRHPTVSNAVVTSWGESPSEKRLVAYIVSRPEAVTAMAATGRSDNGFNEMDVRDFLKQQLPDYMIPAVFMRLDSLPLTANGKVDRRALPPPDPSNNSKANTFVPPSTQTEKALARIWSEVLGHKEIGASDNFFELGGHSLLIMQVIGRVREAFQVDLRIRSLFDSPTLAEFAVAIEEGLLRDVHELPEKEAVRLTQGQPAVGA